MSSDKVFQVTAQQKIAILKEHARSEEDIDKDVLIIREWLKKQPHLPKNIESYLIVRMLRLNKFSLEKTKKKLDMYYTCRTLVPEFFGHRDPCSPALIRYMDVVTFLPLPTLTKTNNRVFVLRFENNDADFFNVDDHATYCFNTFELTLYHDTAEHHMYLIDYRNMTLGHIVKLNFAFLKKIITLMLEAYSARISSIHLMFMPAFANVLMDILQTLLKNKIAGRILAHKNLDSLHKEIDKDDLPSDFGGNQKPISETSAEFKKYIMGQKPWFLEQEKIKSNEKLRIGPSIDADLFGSIHGSFRTLNVD